MSRIPPAMHALDIALPPDALALFSAYCSMLLEANAQVNLTAARQADAVVSTLFIDALTIALALDSEFQSIHAPTVFDVGSGSGSPGLPLKIVFRHWSVVLVESVQKKARFLEESVQRLGLVDVRVEARRAEELTLGKPYRDAGDLCLARAVAPLPTLLELCAPFAKVRGSLVFPKSGDVGAEIDSARAAAAALHLELHAIHDVSPSLALREGRRVVVYRKLRPTPPGYPRRTGLARSRPIGSSPALSRRPPRDRSTRAE